MNIWDDDWGEQAEDWSGGGALSKRLVPGGGPLLGASLYELGRGNFMVYHAHHGSEELLIVLRGRPTLRTPAGERQLDAGEVVHFTTGPEGAHGIRNDTDETVRYIVAGIRRSPEIVEYPDENKVTGQSKHGIFFIHDAEGET